LRALRRCWERVIVPVGWLLVGEQRRTTRAGLKTGAPRELGVAERVNGGAKRCFCGPEAPRTQRLPVVGAEELAVVFRGQDGEFLG
jgi:hypothetical protein